MEFDEFMSTRKQSRDNFMKQLDQMNSGGSGPSDPRFWAPTIGKDGNGYAVIRCLHRKPKISADGKKEVEDLFFVPYYRHSYNYNNKKYFEYCPTTFGPDGKQIGDCPQCTDNKQYYGENSTQKDKDFARPRSRQSRFICNILVVDDPSNPENNGKVFLFDFGKQIYNKIMSKLKPKTEHEKIVYVHDFLEGCNLEIKIFTKKTDNGNFPSYENSEWQAVSPLGDKETMKKVFNELKDIDEFISPTRFKSFEALEKRVQSVCYGKKVAETITEKEEKKKEEDGKSEQKPVETSNENVEPVPENNKKEEVDEEKEMEMLLSDTDDVLEEKIEEVETDEDFFNQFK